MKRAGKIALGCLLAPVALLILAVIFVIGARVAGVPEPSLTQTRLEQPLEATRVTPIPPGTAGSDYALTHQGEDAVVVVLDVEECSLEVMPGPPDKGIQVDADYNEAVYELTQDYGVDKDGRSTYTLKMRAKIHWLRRIISEQSWEDEDYEENYIRVRLPLDTPMELVMNVAKAETEVDLTGLALTDLRARMRMGEFDVEIDEPNSVLMEKAVFDCGMGEFQLHGLAYLGASDILVTGQMGEMNVDLGGPLLRDTNLVAKMRMGEMVLRLPDNAFWEGRLRATMGEKTGSEENPRVTDPEATKLRFDASVLMGEIRVSPYRARSPLSDSP